MSATSAFPQLPRRVLILLALSLLLVAATLLSKTSVVSNIQHRPDVQAIAGSDFVQKGSRLFKTSLIHDVRNRTLGFQDIFILNLPLRTDKRDALALMSKLSGFDVNFIDAIRGENVPDKVLPSVIPDSQLPKDKKHNWPKGMVGAWRAHMNAMREIVSKDIGSALVMEDDIDWDVRLKDLLYDYALSSNAIQAARIKKDAGKVAANSLQFNTLEVPHPKNSPYGDDWDVLWLGHCGMAIDLNRPHVYHSDDPSVPLAKHLKSWEEGARSPLADFAPHTRLVGQNDGTCTLAYAVSQSGARKILYAMAVDKMWSAFDIMLSQTCRDGTLRCLGSLPQLFDHHRPAGLISAQSDISGASNEVREKGFTNNIRWSARLNAKKLLDGAADFDDQFPDD